MPIYTYLCPHCKGSFTALAKKTTDPPPEKCELCGKEGVERVISGDFKIYINEPHRMSKDRMS